MQYKAVPAVLQSDQEVEEEGSQCRGEHSQQGGVGEASSVCICFCGGTGEVANGHRASSVAQGRGAAPAMVVLWRRRCGRVREKGGT